MYLRMSEIIEFLFSSNLHYSFEIDKQLAWGQASPGPTLAVQGVGRVWYKMWQGWVQDVTKTVIGCDKSWYKD